MNSKEEPAYEMERITGIFDWFGKGRFGRFSPDLNTPGLDKLLFDYFRVHSVGHRVSTKDGDDRMHVDVWGYNDNKAFVVKLRRMPFEDDEIGEFVTLLSRFPNVFKEHSNKSIFGLVAAAKITREQRKKVKEAGIYVAALKDEACKIVIDKDFEPRDFGKIALTV